MGAPYWLGFKQQVVEVGKSASLYCELQIRANDSSSSEVPNITLPRKVSKIIIKATVPRTNTRGHDEYSKASELSTVKELCKLAP